MVAQLLYLPIMVPDPSIQLVHEEAMFLTIVHRPKDSLKKKKKERTKKTHFKSPDILEVKQLFCFKYTCNKLYVLVDPTLGKKENMR